MEKLVWLTFYPKTDDWGDKLDPAKTEKYARELMRGAGMSICEGIAKRIQEWLTPGHRYKIGLTGQAAANIAADIVPADRGGEAVGVVERTGYIGNRLIREGIKPRQTSSVKELVPRIIQWASIKGVDLRPRKFATHEIVSFTTRAGKKVEFRAKKRLSNKRRANLELRGAWALATALHYEGTFRTTSDWSAYSPPETGFGRFDYVKWALRNRARFQNQLDKVYGYTVDLLVDWLASGQKEAGGLYFSNFLNP